MALLVRRASGLWLALVGLLLAVPISPAAAAFEIAPDGLAVRLLDAEGNPEARAGSHPDRLQIDFKLETEGSGTSVRDIAVEMPPGLGGNPAAVPACPRQPHEEGEECPPDSQVGVVSFGSSGTLLPIFLLEPEPGQVAAFTSKTGLPIPFEMRLRPDDFGVTFAAEDLPEGAPNEGHIELWGFPAHHQEPPGSTPRPFLTVPTVCGPQAFTLRARSREEGAPWLSQTAETEPLIGCEGLSFAPRLGLQLTNPVADSPSGVRIALAMPAEDEGSELAGAQMRDARIALPAGITISPGGAVGLQVCTNAQFGLGSNTEPSCPAAARVGEVEFSAAALSEPLSGAVYLGEQQGDERFRLFVVAPGPGVIFKFVASLRPESSSGRLVATLHDLPPLAIEQIALSLEGGSGGMLATPLGCGRALADARFVPYGDGPAVNSTASVAIAGLLPGALCSGPLPFAPTLRVSATSARAGRASSFSALIQRRGGEGLPARFSLTMPSGLSAALGAIEPCPDSLATNGDCPAASRVGTVRAKVGSGAFPALLPGGVFLGGPYRRAPFSLVLTFSAVVGPFDLGTVAFRATTQLDPGSGEVTVSTDRLPSEFEGLSIRFQTIELALDRPGLVRNPTSCEPHAFRVELESEEGSAAALTSPYPVSGCKRLGFAPRVKVALAGRGRLRRHRQVGLRISARLRRNDTALRSLALSLPPALKLNVAGLEEICSRADARRTLCPPGSKVGTSVARTALIDEPLRGSIYVVQTRDEGEPDLWVILSGAGMKLAVQGTTSGDRGRFATKLAGLPDMPLSSFSMRLGAPGDSLLSLGVSPCVDGRPRRLRAGLHATGQNGARRDSRLTVVTGARCGSAKRR